MFKSRAPKGAQPRRVISSIEAEDDEETVVIKRQRTAPIVNRRVAPSAEAEIAPTSAKKFNNHSIYSSTGGGYSTEQLASLRASQSFRAAEEIQRDLEEAPTAEFELTGEDAERFEESLTAQEVVDGTDVASAPTPATEAAAPASGFVDETMDFKARLKQKIAAASREAEARKTKDSEPAPVYIPLHDAASEEWEEQMAKRGMRIAAHADLSDTALHKLNEMNASGGVEAVAVEVQGPSRTLAIEDVQLSIAEAVDALKEALHRNERKLEAVKVDLSSCASQETQLRAAMEDKVRLLNDTQELRVFFAELVGMLRSKVPMLRDLREAVLHAHKVFQGQLQRSRVVAQEDKILRLKQAGLLVQLGSAYTPQAVLAESQGDDGLMVDGVLMTLEERERRDEEGASRDKLQARMVELREAATLLFEEVRPDLLSVEYVLEQAVVFRRQHPKQFADVYLTHSLVQLLGPLVEAEVVMLPVLECAVELTEQSWLLPLQSFDEAADKSNEGVMLLAQIIRQVLFPWLGALSIAALDPLSTTHTLHMVHLLNQLVTLNAYNYTSFSGTLMDIFTLYLDAIKALCLPQLKMEERSITFLANQLERATICLSNLKLLLPFLQQDLVLPQVWTVFRSILIPPAIKLLNASPHGMTEVPRLSHAFVDLFPLQPSAARELGPSGELSIIVRASLAPPDSQKGRTLLLAALRAGIEL